MINQDESLRDKKCIKIIHIQNKAYKNYTILYKLYTLIDKNFFIIAL